MPTWTGIFETSLEVEADTEQDAIKKLTAKLIADIQSGDEGFEFVFQEENDEVKK